MNKKLVIDKQTIFNIEKPRFNGYAAGSGVHITQPNTKRNKKGKVKYSRKEKYPTY